MPTEGPRAARDIPAGQPWGFIEHRTIAQVWAEALKMTTMLDLQELVGLLAEHIHCAQREGDERSEDEIGTAILKFGRMPNIQRVLQWLRECALGKALDTDAPASSKQEPGTVLRFRKRP